jgi:copper chaperone CopZ|tara:strand:- start:1607 stop:2017 length:411 start_codon:yes stop_codon:yes gene_type:complete
MCAVLSFLPEMLLQTGGPALAPSTAHTQMLTLRVNGMGCEACQMHVRSVLERSPGVAGAEVHFSRGLAHVLIAEGWGWNVTAVNAQLADQGYELLGVETLNQSKSPEEGDATTGYTDTVTVPLTNNMNGEEVKSEL